MMRPFFQERVKHLDDFIEGGGALYGMSFRTATSMESYCKEERKEGIYIGYQKGLCHAFKQGNINHLKSGGNRERRLRLHILP